MELIAQQTSSQTRKSDFWVGLQEVTPLLLGVFPFALIAGAMAVEKGCDLWQAGAFSLVIFAGASQLATLELLGQDAPLLIILLTGWMVNLRFLIYSAAIAPHFQAESRGWQKIMAYLLTDQAYIMSVSHYEKNPKVNKRQYFMGAAMGLWTVWQIGSWIGILLGAKLPDSLSLEFAIPLTFIALLVPNLKGFPSLASALVSGIFIVVFRGLPLNLGFFIAVFAGICAGMILERKNG